MEELQKYTLKEFGIGDQKNEQYNKHKTTNRYIL